MRKIMELLSSVEDKRQEKKVRHKMNDIIAIVLLASLANANEWMEIYSILSARWMKMASASDKIE